MAVSKVRVVAVKERIEYVTPEIVRAQPDVIPAATKFAAKSVRTALVPIAGGNPIVALLP
jgi:hypothetical protein